MGEEEEGKTSTSTGGFALLKEGAVTPGTTSVRTTSAMGSGGSIMAVAGGRVVEGVYRASSLRNQIQPRTKTESPIRMGSHLHLPPRPKKIALSVNLRSTPDLK